MADGHVIQGSSPAMRRNLQAASLADSLSAIAGGSSQMQEDCDSEVDQTSSEFVNGLVKRLQTTSSEAIVRWLVAHHSENISDLRDKVLQLARSKWSCCPQGKLMRRITRTGGTSASEKLAQDIVLLVKFYESGEATRELKDIFHKVRITDFSHALGHASENASEQINLKKLLTIIEDLEAKFAESEVEHKAEIDKLKEELSHIQLNLTDKNSKITSLETEISTLRANCRASKDQLKSKYDSICNELENISESAKSVSHEQTRLKENIAQLKKKNLNKHSVNDNSNPTNSEITAPCLMRNASNANNNNNLQSYAATISKNNEQNINDAGISIDANECDQNNEVLVSDGNNKDKEGRVIDLEDNLSAKNTDNSQQKELDNASSTSLKEFIGVERRHIKRVYLGGVKDGVDASTIKNFMQEKSVKPTFVRMMKSKRKGTVAVRINVIASDLNKILETSFWPKNVYAREWLSKDKWEKRSVKSDQDQSEELRS